MQTKVDICSGCGKKTVITNQRHKLCSPCNQNRIKNHMEFMGVTPDEETTPQTTKHTTSAFAPVKTHKNKPTGEALIFDAIWATRPHVSFLSGEPINIPYHSPFWYNCFAHVLAKGMYPKMRLFDKNIILLTPEEHRLLDQGTDEQRDNYALKTGCGWAKIRLLAEELKQEYKNL